VNKNGVAIEDTFAEAFSMTATRVIITAIDAAWARTAATAMTGFATSVIGCGVEAGIERQLQPAETPDARPGYAVLLFAMSAKDLEKQLLNRAGQCVLTCPTTALFAGLSDGEPVPLGKGLRHFGDGFQISKRLGTKRYWRLPVMDGEFLCEESSARTKAIGGGNFLVLAKTQEQALRACEDASNAIAQVPNVITPFPGGIVRSGSKVGSKYKGLMASTNDAFCPTLRGLTNSRLPDGVEAVLEIVIDGLADDDIRAAMQAGITAVCARGESAGICQVTAGNYGGKLGQYHYHLHEIMG
jgi:formylmethanofuran--tetrahydromethanopterin N-formyltransferase